MADEHNDATDHGAKPDAGTGATHGGHAGAGLGLSDASRERANPHELSAGIETATAGASSAPRMEPAAAPQASRTAPSSGERGTGGGLGDAAGGARRATAAEMLGGDQRVGDVSIEIPPSGSATAGAAAGAGMSAGTADPAPPGAADPGGGTAVTGDEAGTSDSSSQSDAQSGLGPTASGGRLQDFDTAIRNRDR